MGVHRRLHNGRFIDQVDDQVLHLFILAHQVLGLLAREVDLFFLDIFGRLHLQADPVAAQELPEGPLQAAQEVLRDPFTLSLVGDREGQDLPFVGGGYGQPGVAEGVGKTGKVRFRLDQLGPLRQNRLVVGDLLGRRLLRFLTTTNALRNSRMRPDSMRS